MKRAALCVAVLSIIVGAGPLSSASPKPASGFPIVYMSVRDGQGDLYLLNGLSSRKVSVADSNGHDCGPALRPGGHILAFESNRLTSPYAPSNFEIYAVELRTGKLKQLTGNWPGMDAFPTWSPDGRRIAFTREDPPQVNSIWVMNADGSNAHKITSGDPAFSDLYPSWAPDGRDILFTVTNGVQSSLQVVRPDGTHLRQLTDDGEFGAWSTDGKSIVFDSARSSLIPFESNLFVMKADGSHQQMIGRPLGGTNVMPNWSPDGGHIAYVHDAGYYTGTAVVDVLPTGTPVEYYAGKPGHQSQIWELTLDGKQVVSNRQLTNGTTDFFPHYSPVRNPM